MRRAKATIILILSIAMAVSCGPKLSDTGYQGTWSRGNVHATSTVSIYRSGSDYLFRWQVVSDDGNWEVKCGWDGRCEEFVDGRKYADHVFTTRVAEDGKTLMVECHAKALEPEDYESRYIDELVVTDDGLTLWSYTVERDGEKFEGDFRPRRKLQKISDEVSGSPR